MPGKYSVRQTDLHAPSAGTSAYHIGETANSRSQKTANDHGIQLRSRARRFESDDLKEFDLVVAMDSQNLSDIEQLISKSSFNTEIIRMRDYDPKPGDSDVPDPYYGGIDGFENVFNIVKRSCEALLNELEDKIEK